MGLSDRAFPSAVRWAVGPRWLTEWAFRFLHDRLVPGVCAHGHQSAPNWLRYELQVPGDCPEDAGEAFIWMTAGQAAVVPVALGLPESIVQLELAGRAGLIDLRLPPSGTVVAQAVRLAGAIRGAPLSSPASLAAKEFELARSEHELAALAEDFRRLVDASPYGIVIQGVGGRLLYANDAFAHSVGLLSSGAAAGRPITDLIAFDETGSRAFAGGAADPGGEGSGSTLRGRLIEGERVGAEVFLEVSDSRSVVFDGQPARLVFCRDVTARRRLEREVVNASEGERLRVALELHDGLGQLLAALSMQAQVLGMRMAGGAADNGAVSVADELASTAQEALALARTLARGLAPVAEFDGGLPFALKRLARRVAGASGLDVEVHLDIPDGFTGAGDEIDLHYYRIAQEALHNAAKHSQAKRASVHLRCGDSGRSLCLLVTDDGIGVPESGDTDMALGVGIRAMGYRATAIGATLVLGTNPAGSGTAVSVTVPLPTGVPNAGEITAPTHDEP